MNIRYLHTMVRVKDLDKTMAFFKLLGLEETRRIERFWLEQIRYIY